MRKVSLTFCKVLLTFAILAIVGPRPISAQITPADSAAVLLGAADDFDRGGEAELAWALYRHIVRNYPDTPAGRAALERLGEVGGADEALAGSRIAEPPGDTELKVFSTLYGLWVGTTVPLALGLQRPGAYGAGLLLGGPGGYFSGRAFAQSHRISLGQARAISLGGTWGAWQGMAWAQALDLGADRRGSPSGEAVVRLALVGGAVGILGGALASNGGIRSGTASSAAYGTSWGVWFGAASSVLLGLDENRTWVTTVMAGNAGLIAGTMVGSRRSISTSRARLITAAGVIGGFGGFGLALIFPLDTDRHWIVPPLAGSIAGLALGAATIKDDRTDPPVSANGAAAALSPTGALLSRTGGSWSLAAPAPSPFWVPPPRDGAKGALAWKVPLLEIRF